ncbi:aldehyde dehydrogenase (NADP(+)) [Okibacterium endophyticum]
MSTCDGRMPIAGEWEAGEGSGALQSANPATGEKLDPAFVAAHTEQVDRAARAADDAFDEFRSTSPAQRGNLLVDIAERLDADAEAIVERAQLETGLSRSRLRGELSRTTGQLRLFSSLLGEGGFADVRIDHADARAGTPDVRFHRIPIGPVAVFGASNFPLAFSSGGGDTASALAAGCPVVVKAHNAHLGTGMMVSRHITDAISEARLPGGVYSALVGPGNGIGTALVRHPSIKAVGFTGSRSGGLALVEAARDRHEPIPVFAEMSSINPVVLFPSALTEKTAHDYVDSLTLGSGQLCTNPGLLLLPTGATGDEFVGKIAEALTETVGQTMLTHGIRDAFETATAGIAAAHGVREIARGTAGDALNAPAPRLFEVDATRFAEQPELQAEMFGAAGLVVRYSTTEQLLTAVSALGGQLTASVHAEAGESDALPTLFRLLERRAGRIIVGGWPTGVAVSHAMVHGGPFPATSDSRATSVGTAAIERFLRPITYQHTPDVFLPHPLREDNPWRLPRVVDAFPR